MGGKARKRFKAIKSERLSNPDDIRYVILDTETGEIVDDAQGHGYRTQSGAHMSFAYKQKNIKTR